MSTSIHASVLLQWPTYIVSGRLQPAALVELVELIKRTGTQFSALTSKELLAAIEGTSTEIETIKCMGLVSPRIETWAEGHLEALCEHPASCDYIALMVLEMSVATQGATTLTSSGAIFVHDPRAGSANVFVPGLPYGRPFEMNAMPGSYLIYPAWLRCSVLPVMAGNTTQVLRTGLIKLSDDDAGFPPTRSS